MLKLGAGRKAASPRSVRTRPRIWTRAAPPTLQQLYAIARKTHTPGIDMGEWAELMKLRLLKDGHEYPAGDLLVLAMKQIGKSLEPDVYRIQRKPRR